MPTASTPADPPPLPPPVNEEEYAAATTASNDGTSTATGNDAVISAAVAAAAAASVAHHASRKRKSPAEAKSKSAKKKKAASSTTAEEDSSSLLPKRVSKTSFTYKSDIEASNAREAHSCGILHVNKSTSSCDEHAFGWIVNINDVNLTKSMVSYFQKYGFRPSAMKFIPFSSKENWLAKYPHAKIHLECGEDDGKLIADEKWEAEQSGAVNALTKNKKVTAAMKKAAKNNKTKAPPKLLARGRLPNTERDELHREIYNYFTWLHEELSEMETHNAGRRQVMSAGVSVPALKALLGKLEGTFKQLELDKAGKENEKEGGPDSNNTLEAEAAVPTNTNTKELPFLERGLETDLQRKVMEKMPLEPPSTSVPKKKRATKREIQAWRNLDFDTLFQKLQKFKEEEGHVSPPMKHPELGCWVRDLRANKKKLQERGLAWEPEDELTDAKMEAEEGKVEGQDETPADAVALRAAAAAAASSPKKSKEKMNVFLTKDRVLRLNSIEFPWSVLPARVTWDDRLEQLRQFKEVNGRWPKNREGTIGNWLKIQRSLYTKNDTDFMANKRWKMEGIGVPLRQRHYTAMSWDDRFQQLVEFGRVNRHFNVPSPIRDNGDPESREKVQNLTPEAREANRFYKFVQKIHMEYRALQRGVPSDFLTEERISQLRNVGFEFSLKSEKTVPVIDWSSRIQQLESFHSEMGHMRVDPNYDKYSNLGGWAVEISEQYKSWQEGREYLPPDVVDKFNQLSAMGFGFDVFHTRRGERSWDDSFNLLLQYRQETGSTRVPHHYKADFRLGSWVAVQRKEYKLFMEGKSSRLTQERIQKLDSIGFEWVARRQSDD